MSYATQADFIRAFGREETVALTNLEDASAEEIDSEVISRALADATALIDSYLAGRYSLPFASVPQVLIPKCLDIARYRLDRNAAREDVRQRYEDVIRWLEMVAKGVIQLGLNALGSEAKAESAEPDFFTSDRVYTNDTLKDFVGN